MGLERKEYDLRRTLVMFVAQVLHHGPERLYTNDSWPLPVGHPEIYYEDDVEALRQILPQGVLWGICKSAGGWEQRALLQGREAGVAKAHVQRFWEANAGLELRFGEGAVQLCEGLYNVVATRPPKGTDVPRRNMHTTSRELSRLKRLDLEGPGDMLLTYWMFVGLWKDIDPDAPESRRAGTAEWRPLTAHFVQKHPLLELRYGPWQGGALRSFSEASGGSHPVVKLLNGPLRSSLPWLLEHALDRWVVLEHHAWRGEPEVFITIRRRQLELIQIWIAAIRYTGWHHLLPPFVDVLRRMWLLLVDITLHPNMEREWPRRVSTLTPAQVAKVTDEQMIEQALVEINTAFATQRQQERFHLREAWGQLLGAGALVNDLYREARRVHPAEREAHHTWLIDWWAREENDAILERLRAVSRGIEGRLG